MSEIHAKSGLAVRRLRALGLALPPVVADSAYVNHRRLDSSSHVAGQLPYKDGQLLGQAIVGRDVELETGRDLARHAGAECARRRCRRGGRPGPGADRADAGVRGQHARVRSAVEGRRRGERAFVEVLGENGLRARTAIGVASLPRHSPVEIQMVCTAVRETQPLRS